MDLLKIIAEMHTLTTGIYYNELQKLIDTIVETPDKDIKKHIIICKGVVASECRRIGDYFKLQVIISELLPENTLIVYMNKDRFKDLTTKYEFL